MAVAECPASHAARTTLRRTEAGWQDKPIVSLLPPHENENENPHELTTVGCEPTTMSAISSESQRIGLCSTCQHLQRVRTDKSAVFYLCHRSVTDPGYPKYPRLPVLACRGHERKDELPESCG